MRIIRYQVWKYPPSWKSIEPLGIFDFHVGSLVERVQTYMKWYDDHPALHKYPAQRELRQTQHTLVTELQALPEGISSWQTSDKDRIWWQISPLVFEGAWNKVVCPQCDNEWTFADCTTENWSVGEYLAAEGGRLLLCPHQHLLCRSREWNS